MPIDSITASDRALLHWGHAGQYGVDFLVPGMRVEVVNNTNLRTYAHLTVESVNRINKNSTEVAFAEPLPENASKSHLIAADEDYPEVLVRGCRMSGNRARGLLLGSRGRIVIERNYFHIAGAAILFEGDGNYWFEQSGVRNVSIRDNVFENCNYGSLGWGECLHSRRKRHSRASAEPVSPEYPGREQCILGFRSPNRQSLLCRRVRLYG